MPIVWRLSEIMARQGVKGADLVEKLGLTKESVSRLKNRRTMPVIGPERLEALLTALNDAAKKNGETVRINDLIDWQGGTND